MATRIAGATHDAVMDLSILIAHQFVIGLWHGISACRCFPANGEPAVQDREILIAVRLLAERLSRGRLEGSRALRAEEIEPELGLQVHDLFDQSRLYQVGVFGIVRGTRFMRCISLPPCSWRESPFVFTAQVRL
jgi:hypothetical protein